VLGAWLIWLCFVSTLSLSSRISIPCTALVLIFGTFYWSVTEGFFIFLAMGMLYRAFSMTPPGLYWMALSIIFIFLKIIMFRISVRTIPQLLVTIFLAALALDIVQWLLLRMVTEVHVGSWVTLGGIFLSALLQTIIGIIFVRPLLSLVAHK
jgi:hypothetical protein